MQFCKGINQAIDIDIALKSEKNIDCHIGDGKVSIIGIAIGDYSKHIDSQPWLQTQPGANKVILWGTFFYLLPAGTHICSCCWLAQSDPGYPPSQSQPFFHQDCRAPFFLFQSLSANTANFFNRALWWTKCKLLWKAIAHPKHTCRPPNSPPTNHTCPQPSTIIPHHPTHPASP